MDSDQNRIEQVFSEAVEICNDVERAKFLDAACGEDVGLRSEIERLLAHDQDDSFLSPPDATDGPATGSEVDLAEREIGHYRILEKIGEGGMGVVYMAEQREPITRRVALKIIKPGMDSGEVVARFEAERQALAMMEHRNIARVLDAGATDSGRPYFVMELVNGVPLTEYCDANQLTARERLELFQFVCRAVQHAHQKGIIHRDIKPSNVLVTMHDGMPVPKVIDFGIAKAISQRLTEKTSFTHFGQMLGSPLYMSPEQAERSGLDIDTRSDIYSLGVVLYELLTGTTPFDKSRFAAAAYDHMCEIIREEEPKKPSDKITTLGAKLKTVATCRSTDPASLGNQLRGELDWIVMKSLEKDRTLRYETAVDFAQDIRRYLEDEPVEACPPSAMYRLRKSARRHKTALVFGVAISLALVLGLAGMTWEAYRATKAESREREQAELAIGERDEADEQRQIAEKETARAELHFQQATAAVDAMLTEVADGQLADHPQFEPLRRALLEKALTFYLEFMEAQPDDPDVRFETAQAHRRAGEILNRLGETERAEKQYRQSIQILESLGDDAALEDQYDLLRSLGDLAFLLVDLNRAEEALEVTEQAIKLAREFVAGASDKAPHRHSLAKFLNAAGLAYQSIGRFDESVKTLGEAVDVSQKVVEDRPDEPKCRSTLAEYQGNLGHQLCIVGKIEDGEKMLRSSIGNSEKLVADFPQKADYQQAMAVAGGNLAMLLDATGRSDEAESVVRRSLKIYEKLARESPAVPSYRMHMAHVLDQLAVLLQNKSDLEEAEAAHRKGLKINKQLVADFPDMPLYRTNLAMTYGNLGIVLKMSGRKEEGDQLLLESINILRQSVVEFPDMPIHREHLAASLQNRGYAFMQEGNAQEAEKAYLESLKICEQLVADFPEVANYQDLLVYTLNNLAKLMVHEKRYAEAKKTYQRVLQIAEQMAKKVPGMSWQETMDKAKQRLQTVDQLLESVSERKE